MTPVVIGDATLYCGDARAVLPGLGGADAVVTDPPYGIGEAAGKAKTRSCGLTTGKTTAKIRDPNRYIRDYGDSQWDDEPISDEFMAAVRAAAKWQIIFGGNYYNLPPTSCWLVWDKLNGDNDFADCELAWTNLPKAVRRLRLLWNGCMRVERHIEREHPTQKPVGVMSWCLRHLPDDAQIILDPFMGSGTTGVACAQQGRKFIGIEREQKYFDIACKRIEAAYAQGRLFSEPEAAPEQGKLLGDAA